MVVVHHLDKRLHLGPVLDFLLAHSSCDFPREAIYPSHQTVSVWLVLCTVIMVLQHKHQHLQLGVIWHAVFIWLVMVLQHKHQHLQLYDIWQAVSVWLALPVYHHCGSATQASASTTLCHLAGSVHTACPPCVPPSWSATQASASTTLCQLAGSVHMACPLCYHHSSGAVINIPLLCFK